LVDVEVGFAVEGFEVEVDVPGGGVVPEPPEGKVLPMAPHLMFEKVTEAPGELASTSTGFPEVVEQDPRLTPASVGDLVEGYGASSHCMLAVWSSQMDMTRTIPFAKALPILARPPLVANVLVSPKAVFWAAQKESVMEFPETPATLEAELAIVLPF